MLLETAEPFVFLSIGTTCRVCTYSEIGNSAGPRSANLGTSGTDSKTFVAFSRFSIEQIDVFECKDPGFLEVQLHRHFASKRMRGEWFRLDQDDLSSWRIMAPKLAQRTNFRKQAANIRKGQWSKEARARVQRSRESRRLSTLSNQASR